MLDMCTPSITGRPSYLGDDSHSVVRLGRDVAVKMRAFVYHAAMVIDGTIKFSFSVIDRPSYAGEIQDFKVVPSIIFRPSDARGT